MVNYRTGTTSIFINYKKIHEHIVFTGNVHSCLCVFIQDDFVRECKDDERHALLHVTFETLMDKPSTVRDAAGRMCFDLLNKSIFKPQDLVMGCVSFLKKFSRSIF